MFYFINDEQISVYFKNGDVGSWHKSNNPELFARIAELCEKSDWLKIEILHNQCKAILNNEVFVNENGTVSIINKEETTVCNCEDSKIIKFIKLLKDKGVIDSQIDKIKPFLKNMFENPYIDAVTEIYDFCTKMDFEITEDGCFLAYKNVNKDLSSIYDNGKTKHKIGEYTEVDDFNTDRTVTCSKGLHFCSKDYLKDYRGDVTIIVKVNPKDVVSIPVDYNFMKGRCKKYLTVGILDKNKTLEETDIEEITDNKVKVVKAISRIQETANLLEKYGDINRVAKEMNISVETVKRNMRKFRSMYNEG